VIAAIGKYGHGKGSMLSDVVRFSHGRGLTTYVGVERWNRDPLPDWLFHSSSRSVLMIDSLFYNEDYFSYVRRAFSCVEELKRKGEHHLPFVLRICLNNDDYRFATDDVRAQLCALADDPINRSPELAAFLDEVYERADFVLPFQALNSHERRELIGQVLKNKFLSHCAWLAHESKQYSAAIHATDSVLQWTFDRAVEDGGEHFTGNSATRAVDRLFDIASLHKWISRSVSPIHIDLKNGVPRVGDLP
jgi:hypothetical protein